MDSILFLIDVLKIFILKNSIDGQKMDSDKRTKQLDTLINVFENKVFNFIKNLTPLLQKEYSISKFV